MLLAPYSVPHDFPAQRLHPESDTGRRTPYQRDRDRIIHSTAFRRLEYKTQVFVNHEGDLFRTRLTHTIEVAQIARSIARSLGLNEDLTEAISLAHDLGHPPFGHAGQRVLNQCMASFGGFEHNFQSLRIVEYLEYRYPTFRGLNLSVATREGILKHCSKKRAETLGSLGARFINGGQPSLEAQLANLADEIAYVTHDVDDGLRSGLLSVNSLLESELFAAHYRQISTEYKVIDGRRQIYETVRRMIRELVSDLIDATELYLGKSNIDSLEKVRASREEAVRFSAQQRIKIDQLKSILNRELYQHYRVQRMSSKATQIIESLFSSFLNDVRLLPDEAQMEVRKNEAELGIDGRARAVTDYIAGMTDRYAITEYQRLFDPLQRT